jgi:hypothetical protein
MMFSKVVWNEADFGFHSFETVTIGFEVSKKLMAELIRARVMRMRQRMLVRPENEDFRVSLLMILKLWKEPKMLYELIRCLLYWLSFI